MVYEVKVSWDSDARVWVAESDDVPGLVTEADSFDAVVQKVLRMIPELLELNRGQTLKDRPEVVFKGEWRQRIAVA